MRKVALSAAILALSMMGCSDVGLDNSVASTNEVNVEPAQESSYGANFLAKSGYVWPTHSLAVQEPLQKVDANNYVYHSYNTGIKLNAGTWVDQGSNNGVGWFKMHREGGQTSPDYIRIITLPLYNCHWSNFSQTNRIASCVTNYNYFKVAQQYNVDELLVMTDTDLVFHEGDGFQYQKQSVMTYYIAVWSEGQPNQVILAGTIYNGNLLKRDNLLARKVYEQIFIPSLNEYIAHH